MHRLQFRFRPSDTIELVPQFWLFKADSATKIGGNPALTYMNGTDLAAEVNLTAKWFVSRNVLVQGHIAATFPGSGTEDTLAGADLDPWVSAMVFVRIAF